MPEKHKALHIFRAGTHTASDGRSLSFAESDLAATAKAYNPDLHEAPIVVGHPRDDAPAYGWVRSLAASGPHLSAVPAQVEPAFAEAVAAGRYKKISAGFYHPESAANPVPGVWYLRHVGFLGSMPPAVKGLAPPSFAGGQEDFVSVEFGEEVPAGALSRIAGFFRGLREYIINKDGLDAADAALPSWSLDRFQEDAAEAQAMPAPGPAFAEQTPARKETPMPDMPDKKTPAAASAPSEAPDLTARLTALEAREAAFAERLRRQEAQEVVNGAVAAGRLTAAQSEGLVELLAGLHEEATIAFGEGEVKKMVAPAAFLRDFLQRLPVQVEFSERSAPAPDASIDGAAPEYVARRAVMYRERLSRDGVIITTTEAVAAVKAGTDKKENA
ncbi:MAG: hypothetical protein LBQ51_05505 [Desulfovibrio sp.]|jgi:hypothetical protein|nr:hypothetical protein [Desulfovibrio sp.]